MSTFIDPFLAFGPGLGYGYYGIAPEVAPVDPEGTAKPSEPVERQQPIGGHACFPGFPDAPPWSYSLALQIAKHEAVALANMVIRQPIVSGTRTLELLNKDTGEAAPDDGKPNLTGNGVTKSPQDKQKEALERHFDPLWPSILNGLECINFGHWDQEILYDRFDGLTLPKRFKDFQPGEYQVLRDKYGDFAGIRYQQQDILPPYVLHHVHQPHRNALYGFPRSENARVLWWRSYQSDKNGDRTEQKASGISLMVHADMTYVASDARGAKVSATHGAQTIFDSLKSGGAALVPRFAFDRKDVQSKPELAEFRPFEVDQFDWGKTAPAIMACIARIDSLSKRIMRAYGRPEREAMTGDKGTNAESETQGAIGTLDSEALHGERMGQFNEQVWEAGVRTNGLPPSRWKPTPLADPQQQFMQKAFLQLMTTPATSMQVESITDLIAAAKRVEWPTKPNPVLLPPVLPTTPPPQPGAPVNGNGRMAQMGKSTK